MVYSAARLTCFALLSALEEDLRIEIEAHFGADDNCAILSPEEIAKATDRTDRKALHPVSCSHL